MIKPIIKKSVSDETFEQMLAMISEKNWKPGDKIPSENDLTQMFNVSRVTVREALKKLISYGIVESRHGSGTFIKQIDGSLPFDNAMGLAYFKSMDDSAIENMMEFRSIVEIEAVRLATIRATPEELAELEKLFNDMISHKRDIKAFSRYDFEFHKYIAGMTKNMVLIKCYSIIWDFIRTYFDKIVMKIGVEKGSYYHGLILEAMKDGDSENASRLMKMHLDDTRKIFFGKETREIPH